MGSRIIQAKLWGQHPGDWADIQEPTGRAGYESVLDTIPLNKDTRLLDIGCGTGYFCSLAEKAGAGHISGIDATPEFIKEASRRVPAVAFLIGDMEDLPYENTSFDVVCGFNSFQYAADTKNALLEVYRVLKVGGKLAAMIWGNKEDCEAASYLKALGSLLPPPPPGAGGPFALTEENRLEHLMEAAGFTLYSVADIPAVWTYPDPATALKGLLSAGPAAKAIEHSGFEKVYRTVEDAIQPYLQSDGRLVLRNKFRVAIADKSQVFQG